MSYNSDAYFKLLQHLLPRGTLWTRNKNSGLSQFLQGAADELSRFDAREDDLILEMDSRTTTELIEKWEEEYGLPEAGEELAPTLAERRADVLEKKLQQGRQDKQYFIDLAAALGYTVTIVEHTPGWCGLMTVGEPCGDQTNLFIWTMLIEIDSDILPDIKKLEQKINDVKPGHTRVLFNFEGPEFGRGFGRGFDSIPSYDGSFYPGSFSPEFSNAFRNNVYYDGTYRIGAFNASFNLAFDAHIGGSFFKDEFSSAFKRPS
jgi:uncharacterized protein YmfQ (DUF2313 family)